MIPGPDTLPEVVDAVSSFADLRLGKGVVRAQDIPGFIANRIGTFCACNIFRLMSEEGFAIEEADQLTGPAIGWPKTATFGTIDLAGLDILAGVTRSLTEHVRETGAGKSSVFRPSWRRCSPRACSAQRREQASTSA